MQLNQRHVDILLNLLEAEKPVPANVLARDVGTTPRVVRYHLHQLEGWLKKRDLDLHQQPGVGISIRASKDIKNQMIQELSQKDLPVSHFPSEDRFHILLLLLLTRPGISTVKQFQFELKAARTTILTDLEKVSRWLMPFDIHLRKRQNFGCYLQGREMDIRRATISLLVKVFGEVELLSLYGDLENRSLKDLPEEGRRGPIPQYIRSLDLVFFDGLIDQIQDINHRLLTDRGRMILSMQMAVSIRRLENGSIVDIPSSEIELLRLETDYHLSAILVEKIHRHFSISIPEPEIAYLMMGIKEAEYRRQIINPVLLQEINPSRQKDVDSIVDTLLGYVGLYMHPALRLDQELRESLVSHFLSLEGSPGDDSTKEDPLLEDMKRVYPETYRITRASISEVNQKLGTSISEEEVGYISMHLVAAMERLRRRSRTKKKVIIICNAGVATSKLLASRVITEFPELEISRVSSYLEYKNNSRAWNCDLLITTIPVPPVDRPSIFVSPLLDREDVRQIRYALDLVEHRDPFTDGHAPDINEQASLADLLTRETIELQCVAQTWQDLIDKGGGLLLNIHAIEPAYISAMKSVREEYGPYMVIMPGLALLHAFPGDGVKHLCMSMVTLKTPVLFGHPDFDPVQLAFTLGAVDNHSHLRALSELIDMVKHPGTVASLCGTMLKPRVLNIISQFSKPGQMQAS